MRIRYYPCHTCWPQAHCTVSVGTFFVNCCLQTGQGFVITYVITLFSLRGLGPPVEEPVHVACQKSCLFADRAAQDSPVPDEAAAGFRKQGPRATSSAPMPLLAYRVAHEEPGNCERRFVAFAVNNDIYKARVDLFCFRVSAIESCKDTAVAVAQIFSVASRKFRSLVGSTVYPSQNRLQWDGTSRALGGVEQS